MAKLVPSILSKDFHEISEKLDLLSSVPEIEVVQIDFADGKFVNNHLVEPVDFSRIGSRLTMEAHLMVVHPQKYFSILEHVGFRTVFVHFESFHSDNDLKSALSNIRTLGMRSGLAVNPHTDIIEFERFSDFIDEALLMGVEPGFQGSEFIDETFTRLENLRKLLPDKTIEVDGGLKIDNIRLVMAAGADKMNVGSGIWHSADPRGRIRDFLKIIEG